MSLPDLTALIRAGLALNLQTSIPDVQISPYALSQPTPPGIQILPGELAFDLAMGRGLDSWSFTVQPFVAFTTDIGSQVLLDKFLDPFGPKSIKAAVESDRQLGGVAEDLVVRRATGYRVVDQAAGGQLIVVDFTVDVFVTGTP